MPIITQGHSALWPEVGGEQRTFPLNILRRYIFEKDNNKIYSSTTIESETQ